MEYDITKERLAVELDSSILEQVVHCGFQVAVVVDDGKDYIALHPEVAKEELILRN